MGATGAHLGESVESKLGRYLAEMGVRAVVIRQADGSRMDLDADKCVAALRLQLVALRSSADSHASQLLRMGWMLLQVRRFIPYGSWTTWLQQIDRGFHGKRVEEWMRVAAEFARDDGSPDPEKLMAHGICIEPGGVNASWTRLRTIVRDARKERRAAQGIKQPGKADSVSQVLAGGLDDEVDGDEAELFEGEAPAPVDEATRAARIAALKAAMAGTPRTDNETDMLPDPVGIHRETTHVARVGEVPSAGDSGTHAPVQNPGVASDVGGSFRTSGPGEAETPMVQATSVRGASGDQITIEGYIEEIRSKRESILARIQTLAEDLACHRVDAETVISRMERADKALCGQAD